jgi:hypothetical protein
MVSKIDFEKIKISNFFSTPPDMRTLLRANSPIAVRMYEFGRTIPISPKLQQPISSEPNWIEDLCVLEVYILTDY